MVTSSSCLVSTDFGTCLYQLLLLFIYYCYYYYYYRYSRKTNLFLFYYKLCESLITRTECIKDLGVQIVSKLHFHNHNFTTL
jgi:hypothetical protein